MGSEVNLCHINSIFKVPHKLTYRIQISYPKKKGTHRIELIQVCAFKYAMIIELFGRSPEMCQPFWRLFVSKPLNIEFSEVKIKSNFDGEFPDIDGSTSFLRIIFYSKDQRIWQKKIFSQIDDLHEEFKEIFATLTRPLLWHLWHLWVHQSGVQDMTRGTI